MPGVSFPALFPAPLHAGDLPVVTQDDVIQALPVFMRKGDTPPVLDALTSALYVILATFQARAAYASALSDVLYSIDKPLEEIGQERGVFKNTDESNEAYRARILSTPDLVTPEALIAAANSILAPYTAVQARYCESIGDRMIARRRTNGNASISPRAYVYRRATVPRSPDYPDRFYVSEAAANGGRFVPARDPGKARTFQDRIGRIFIMMVPDISPIDSGGAFAYAETQTVQYGWFISDGTSPNNSSFLRQAGAISLGIYQNIVNVVERIKGHSIRWKLEVDANLT